jgi:hypothetical protein
MLAQGEIDHGGDGETPFGGQTHGGTPSAGGGATNELNDGWPHAEPNRLKTPGNPAGNRLEKLYPTVSVNYA